MINIPEDELRTVRTALDAELAALQANIEALMARASIVREKIKAIDTLIQPSRPEGTASTRRQNTQNAPRRTADSWGEFTPTEAYWMPILEAVEERGGREHSDVVLELVEKKMASVLAEKDYETLPSGLSVRWRNRAQWQRQNMVQQGLLSSHSPRGIWEITSAGREWLRNKKRKAS